MTTQRYDVAVLGAGPGGYVAAIRAAQLGKKTVLIEKRATLGGTCLNVGCIPSKALLESSEHYHQAKHKFADHGVQLSGVELDLKTMVGRKDKLVDELVRGIALLMAKNKISVLYGHGRLLGEGKIAIEGAEGTTEVEAEHIILATGSIPIELPFARFDGERIISSTEALSLSEVPKHLIVIGAGAIGLEMGSVWARLGAEVTVVELLDRIAIFAEKQVSKTLQRSLQKQGMTFKLKHKMTAVEVEGETVKIQLETPKGETETLEGDRVLIAVGRRPVTADCGLEAAGVELNERGQVKTDEMLRTTAKNIWAIGDLIDGPMLAHKAEEEGVAVAETIAGGHGHVNYSCVPNVIYTWPELAQVGITEAEAKEAGHTVRTGKFSFRANGRAKSMAEEEGFCKIVADAESDRLLGVHILGPRASDMIAEAVVAMEFAGSAEDLARSFHAHPTLAEVIKEAALAVDGRALHG